MSQLPIIVRQLTDDLNKIVENMENKKDEDDDISMLLSAGIILEDIKKLLNKNPVVRYDSEKNILYLFFPDGRKEY
ncbi:hypothetical protein [Senegalia massiliensis]|uniref:Uncharacterized protein n=1 Tax=Senegalia massiliensis TaxID=1720316 RepID=A0A845QXU2_9CLOT|nr:hypothetical protein [Senegalia massiliensis]NBI07295.1 hypothetical protein [Senegalia massiliensis]